MCVNNVCVYEAYLFNVFLLREFNHSMLNVFPFGLLIESVGVLCVIELLSSVIFSIIDDPLIHAIFIQLHYLFLSILLIFIVPSYRQNLLAG